MRQSVETVPRPGEEDDVYQLVSKAQRGDLAARDHLIRIYTPFVMRAASSSTKRYVTMGKDDEASIALIAFNEAISGFSEIRSKSFFAFAETVIRRRLIDYFRKNEQRSKEIPASSFAMPDEESVSLNPVEKAENALAAERAVKDDEVWERREEIRLYSEHLLEYGIRFTDLIVECPKHADAKQRAIEVARMVAEDPLMRVHLKQKRELPLKALEKKVQVSRKTLERQRRYIIAIAVILMEDLNYLGEYLR